MRVTLTTLGTNHTFHLARQMYKRNALVSIFSGYPLFKLKHENLPLEKIKSFPYLLSVYMNMGRVGLNSFWLDRQMLWWANTLLDRYAERHLEPSDVFLALSNTGLQTGLKAQKQGSIYICDRGCSHIRYQDMILREEYALQGIPYQGIDPRVIEREEREYAVADAITVPSTFAKRSFIEMGVPEAKLHLIPYGADLAKFQPTDKPNPETFEVLFVGQASIQKGLPYLLEAFARLKHRRKHLHIIGHMPQEVAGLIDKYAAKHTITCTGHCPQSRLKEIMSQSHVLVLPSIQEGFGMVMAEAMACGCPVIATTNTGAQDLYEDEAEGFIVPIRDVCALTERMQELADRPDLQQQMGQASLRKIQNLNGWDFYGATIFDLFGRLIAAKRNEVTIVNDQAILSHKAAK